MLERRYKGRSPSSYSPNLPVIPPLHNLDFQAPAAMRYECGNCTRTFNTLQGAIAHGNAKGHYVSQFYCSQCSREFSDQHALDQVCGGVEFTFTDNQLIHNTAPTRFTCA